MKILDNLLFALILAFSFLAPWTPWYELHWHGLNFYNYILFALIILWEIKLLWLYLSDNLRIKLFNFEIWSLVFLAVNFLSLSLAVYKYSAVLEVSFLMRAFLLYFIIAFNTDSRAKYSLLYAAALTSALLYATLFLLEAFSEFRLPFNWHQILILVASYLTPFVLIAFAWVLQAKNPGLKILAFALSMYFLLASLLCYKRSIIVAVIIALAVMLALRFKHFKIQAVSLFIAVMLFLGLITFLPSIQQKFIPRLHQESLTASYIWRSSMNQASVNMIRDYPWFGVGPGNYAYWFPLYTPEDMRYHYFCSDSHNIWLQITAETGIWGILAFIMIWVSLIRTLWNLSSKAPKHWHYGKTMVLGIFIGLLANMIVQSFEFTWYYFPNLNSFWLLMGIASGILKTEGESYA